MTIKSVVDIDVNDAKFQRFGELFAKYQAGLKKVPGQWRDVADEEKGAATEFEKILASFFALGELQKELGEAGDKDNKNLQKKSSLWQGIKKTTGGILDDVEKTTKTLLKWGLIGLGAGAAGLLGVRAVASSVAADRRFSLATGLDIGAQQAFGRHQGRLFDDPDRFLSSAFAARSSYGPEFATLLGLGISSKQSTVGVADALLTKLQGLAKSVPQQQLGTLLAQYPGLAQFGVGLGTLQQLRAISSGELQGQIKAYGPDLARTKLSAGEGLAFSNFTTRIDAAFANVERQFERDLVRLLPPLERFVERVGGILHRFLASPAAAKALDSLGGALERFTAYLGSPQFGQSIDRFLKVADYLQNPRQATASDLADTADALATDTGFEVPQAVTKGQLRLGGDLGQIVRQDREFMSNLGFVPAQDRLRVMLAEFFLSKQKGFNENEFLHGVRANVYLGNDALHGQPRAASHYAAQALGLKVTIQNNTGGNASATVAQLAGGVAQ